MIPYYKTYTPNQSKILNLIEKSIGSGVLTNNGPLVQELEENLSNFLGVKNLILVSNGTVALQIAYKALNLSGKIITTPFTYVATSSSLCWENLTPLYSDIEEDTFNLNSNLIESLIDDSVKGIVPVHVFGNPCHLEQFGKISQKYNIPVIYDAAHAFHVKKHGESVLNYGDISTLSFHSTKVFHTVEGGALIVKDDEVYRKAKKIREFGEFKDGSFGINAKLNEIQAAFGLAMLDDMERIIDIRRNKYLLYKNNLIGLQEQKVNADVELNYSYLPVVFSSEETLLLAQKKLLQHGYQTRRYFHPSLDSLYKQKTVSPISDKISRSILCLPLYVDLDDQHILNICNIVNEG